VNTTVGSDLNAWILVIINAWI